MIKILIAIIFLPVFCSAQNLPVSDTTIIMGRMTANCYILDKPSFSDGKALKEASKQDFVYLINIVSVPKGQWYHCYYKTFEGYIPLSKVDVYGNYSTQKLNYLQTHADQPADIRASISRRISAEYGHVQDSISKKQNADVLAKYHELEELKDKFSALLFQRVKKEKIVLISYGYPKSAIDFTGFDIRFLSGFEKTIKYADFKIIAYNAVNDIIASKQAQCIGPINPFHSVSYHFENMFSSDIIDHCKISSLRIQFMDKSILTIMGVNLEIAYLESRMDKISELDRLDDILSRTEQAYLNEKYVAPK